MGWKLTLKEATIEIEIEGLEQTVSVAHKTVSMDRVIEESDFITFHVPGGKMISSVEFV